MGLNYFFLTDIRLLEGFRLFIHQHSFIITISSNNSLIGILQKIIWSHCFRNVTSFGLTAEF